MERKKSLKQFWKGLTVGLLLGLIVFTFIMAIISQKGSTENTLEYSHTLFSSPKNPLIPDSVLKGLDSVSLQASFPVKAFLDSAGCQQPEMLEPWIKTMNLKNRNSMDNLKTLATALTTGLQTNRLDTIIGADTALMVFNWAQSWKMYQPTDPNSKIVYDVITDFWLNKVAQSLSEGVKANPDLKYTFKFNYLVQRCGEMKYFANIPATKTDKAIKNLLETKISYLFKRVSTDVPFWILALVGFVGFFTIWAWFVLIRKLILRRPPKS